MFKKLIIDMYCYGLISLEVADWLIVKVCGRDAR